MNRLIPCAIALALVGCTDGNDASKAPVAISSTPSQSISINGLDYTKVAFMGDSITYGWTALASHVPNLTVAGVPGNTTAQMLARYDHDTESQKAGTVVILGGINDIRFQGVVTLANVQAMATEASAAGAKVIIGNLLPDTLDNTYNDADIARFNTELASMASAYGWTVADYHDAMLLPDGTQDTSLFLDGLHPNAQGYMVMWQVLEPLLPHSVDAR